MGFEHLVNNAEKFRKEVIRVNEELYMLNNMINSFSHDDYSRKDLVLRYYKVQEQLNDLYRFKYIND